MYRRHVVDEQDAPILEFVHQLWSTPLINVLPMSRSMIPRVSGRQSLFLSIQGYQVTTVST
jgi:hypothetical protein